MKKRITSAVLAAAIVIGCMGAGGAASAAGETETRTGGEMQISGKFIDAGSSNTLIIDEDGALWRAGHMGYYPIYIGDERVPGVAKVMEQVVSVSAGTGAYMAIKNDGSLWGWGSNGNGILGEATTNSGEYDEPIKIMDSVKSVSVGNCNTYVIKNDGSLWGWGTNLYGMLGVHAVEDPFKTDMGGYYISRPDPTPKKIADDVSAVDVHNDHAAFIKTDGSLWVIGYPSLGRLWDKEVTGSASLGHIPVKVMEGVRYVSVGKSTTMAIKEDGSLWAGGWNPFGQIGDGTTRNRQSFVKIMDSVRHVSAGEYFTIAVKEDGSLWGWGANIRGVLAKEDISEISTSGDLDGGEPVLAPVMIMDSVAIAEVSAQAGWHAVAVKMDGSIWTWGSNRSGQLGDFTVQSRHVPMRVMDDIKLPEISALQQPAAPASNPLDGADGWAVDVGLGEALETGLIPGSFVGNWQQSGRVYAAEALVKFIEVMEGRSMAGIAAERGYDLSNAFLDTDNECVTFLREAAIVGGVGGGYYDPDGAFTRAAMVTMLGQAMERFFGMDLDGYPPGSERFADVSQGYYDKYVGWAADAGIVGGHGGGVFAPDDPITNQQLGILFLQALRILG